jgi:hypothetical protein
VLHAWPQPPQFVGSDCVFAQWPLQSVRSGAHVVCPEGATHVLFTHLLPCCAQANPQRPQLDVSLEKSKHVPLHMCCLPGHAGLSVDGVAFAGGGPASAFDEAEPFGSSPVIGNSLPPTWSSLPLHAKTTPALAPVIKMAFQPLVQNFMM